MIAKNTTLKGRDNAEIYTYIWLPDQKEAIRGIVQISHGMAEHALRYERLAKYLTEKGCGVYANDHRGHGKTAGSIENLGYFADQEGWESVVNDMVNLTEFIKSGHPEIPIFLFGHSMGSMLCRDFIVQHGNLLQGVILSGTAGNPGILGKVGSLIANLIALISGKKTQSPLLDSLSFGNFNRSVKNPKTKSDWLSRDESEVAKYINDPYCGTIFTAGFFKDLLYGMLKINSPQTYANTPKDLPIFLFSGADDPVGNNTVGVEEVASKYRAAGSQEVKLKFYEGGRHEMLNETNRDEVMGDIVTWLDQHLEGALSQSC